MTTVIIADDHPVVREGIRGTLESDPDISVVGQASDGTEALAIIERVRPDVALLDIDMPGVSGLEACELLVRQGRPTRVLLMTEAESERQLDRALQAGARGVILKQGSLEEIPRAVRAVMQGNVYLAPQLTSLLVHGQFNQDRQTTVRRTKPLSVREEQILRLIATGLTNPRIAQQLKLSIKTVQAHRSNIMAKLNLHDTASLVKYALRAGLVNLDEPAQAEQPLHFISKSTPPSGPQPNGGGAELASPLR